jgi:hypothetical protein
MKMHFSPPFFFATCVLAISIFAMGVSAGRPHLQAGICRNLKVADKGCIRYVKSFDITGVVTEVRPDLPRVKDVCGCIQDCFNRSTTSAFWV